MNDGKSWLNKPRECAVHKLHGTFLFYFPFLLHHPVRLLQHSRKIKLSFPAGICLDAFRSSFPEKRCQIHHAAPLLISRKSQIPGSL